MKSNRLMLWKCIAAAALSGIIVACGGGDGSSSDDAATYRVSLTNITHNQPLSPPAVILHTDGYTAWRIGEAVSVPMEVLAEGGDPTDLVNAAAADSTVLATDLDEQHTGAAIDALNGRCLGDRVLRVTFEQKRDC